MSHVDTHLENQETLVIQIDTAALKQRSDFTERTVAVVDCVFARVVPVSSPGNYQLGAWHDFVRIGPRLV